MHTSKRQKRHYTEQQQTQERQLKQYFNILPLNHFYSSLSLVGQNDPMSAFVLSFLTDDCSFDLIVIVFCICMSKDHSPSHSLPPLFINLSTIRVTAPRKYRQYWETSLKRNGLSLPDIM